MNFIINSFYSLMNIHELEILFKLILIAFLSGFVGWERESWNKPAGFRTHVLVGISAVLVMVCGDYLHSTTGADPSRIPAQLLSGIGFLGAGTILRDGFNVKGLTTAAGLLAVTCIGLAVGAGDYLGAIIATAVVYAVLSYSHVLSGKLEHYNFIDLEVISETPKEILENLRQIFSSFELEIVKMQIVDSKSDEHIRIILKYKERVNMNEIMSQVMKIEQVKEVVEVKEG